MRPLLVSVIALALAATPALSPAGDALARPESPERSDLDAPAQTATFTFAQAIEPGSYQLSMDYTGKIQAYPAANLAVGSRRGADTAAANVEDRIRERRDRLPLVDAWLLQQPAQ